MDKKEVLISLALAGIVLSVVFKNNLYLVSGMLLFIYLAFPRVAELIGKIFLKFTRTIGKFFSFLFLGIIFYVVLLPVSLFYRVFHSNPLFLKVNGLSSTFVKRDIEYTKESLENMW
jgi:hypothetical protein